MNRILDLLDGIGHRLDRLAPMLLPTLARLVFAGVLLVYFWTSARTKLGDGLFGLFHPSLGAYAQVFPRAFEAAGYDISQMSMLQWAVVEAGMLAEFTLPLLIVVGLATRAAALAMTGFVVVQSLTDIYGHGVDAATRGFWFDADSASAIFDQRAFWLLALAVLMLLGPGPLSADRLIQSQRA